MGTNKLEEKLKTYNEVIAQRLGWMEEVRKKVETKDIVKVKGEKKKIAIIYDVEGWAFHNIAKQLQKNLSKYYEIDIFPKSIFSHNVVRLMFLAKHYDLVHLLWRGMFSELEGDYIKGYIRSLGLTSEEFTQRFVFPVNITTSVYDHSFLNKEAFKITKAFLKYSKTYTVSSKKLLDIYNESPQIIKKPLMEITDGVDLEKFKPKNLERFSNIKNRTVKIGWVGNSKFENSENDNDLKGVRKIIIPAIEELIKEGYKIERKFADRNEGYIPHDKMPDYYNSIDLYICASKEEGTPNPVLESMACGVPIITTDVGIVPEAFGKLQKEYILKERTKEDLKEKIKQILKKPEQWEKLSKENLEQIKNWSWEEKCEQFKEFFDISIKQFEQYKEERGNNNMADIIIKNPLNLLGGISPVLYGTSQYHKLLSDDNIGENGENLTIVVLSCERANATIEMMKSIKKQIPNFKGKYMIADNGSSKETIEKLKKEIKKMPYECELLEFGENLGVAKGRNKAVEHVKTDWFMSLDNDILFACNILPEIQNTISQLGCNFVNLPLLNETGDRLFAAGGNIFIEPISNGIHIGCGGAFEQSECKINETIPRSLSTFLFGGASVIRKKTFEECGKFDEGMFVGFEDIDFSITLFKKGYKIGTIGKLGLIHNHKKPQNQNDLEYEKQRFSNVRLLNSAKYFEKKNNFKVWNEGTENWLKQREKELGIMSVKK